MRLLGFSGAIHSYEPGSAAFALLEAHASSDELWYVHNVALGEIAERRNLHLSRDSVASSLLRVTEAHVKAEPKSRAVSDELVQVCRLDDCLVTEMGERLWLKLDTQGFEASILAGAVRALRSSVVVQCELSILPCYEDQADYRYLIGLLHGNGFDLCWVEPGTQDRVTGQLLQFDGIWAREEVMEPRLWTEL